MKPGVLLFVLALLPARAAAQVVVNQAALAQLAGVVPQVVLPAAPVARAPVHHHPMRLAVARRKPAVIAVAARPLAPKAMPAAAAAKPAAAAAKPAAAAAKPAALPPVASIRFAPASAALLPGAAALLKPFCGVGGVVSIAAAAPAGDPSAGMRLGLDRAFAVRDALTACGVPAAHILPRVLAAGAGGAPDTAQLSVAP